MRVRALRWESSQTDCQSIWRGDQAANYRRARANCTREYAVSNHFESCNARRSIWIDVQRVFSILRRSQGDAGQRLKLSTIGPLGLDLGETVEGELPNFREVGYRSLQQSVGAILYRHHVVAFADSILSNQLSCAFRFLRQPSRPNPAMPVAKSGRAPGSGPACAGGNANTIRPAPMVNNRTAPKDRNKSFMRGTAFNLVALQSRMDKSRKLEMAGQDKGLVLQRPKIKDSLALPWDHREFGPGDYRR